MLRYAILKKIYWYGLKTFALVDYWMFCGDLMQIWLITLADLWVFQTVLVSDLFVLELYNIGMVSVLKFIVFVGVCLQID